MCLQSPSSDYFLTSIKHNKEITQTELSKFDIKLKFRASRKAYKILDIVVEQDNICVRSPFYSHTWAWPSEEEKLPNKEQKIFNEYTIAYRQLEVGFHFFTMPFDIKNNIKTTLDFCEVVINLKAFFRVKILPIVFEVKPTGSIFYNPEKFAGVTDKIKLIKPLLWINQEFREAHLNQKTLELIEQTICV